MEFLNNVKNKILLGAEMVAFGMKGANDKISEINDMSNTSTSITAEVGHGGVLSDLLQNKLTQDVKETRDAYYRVLAEADKYRVKINMTFDENGDIDTMSGEAQKKTLGDYVKHCLVDESDGFPLRVIQDNKPIQKESNFDPEALLKANLNDFDTILSIERDFTPSIEVEKYCTKIVVKNISKENAIVDLYFPTMAGQFTKTDAILIAKLNEIFNTKVYKTPLFDFKRLYFTTDKPWLCESFLDFEYNNLNLTNISIFDGSFVVRFTAHIVKDGEAFYEKYKTEELTKKYEEHAPKSDAVDVFALEREINKMAELTNKG